MNKITKWSIINENGTIHNHIENGFSENDKPQPTKPEYTNQIAWQNYEWKRDYCYLNDECKVVHIN